MFRGKGLGGTTQTNFQLWSLGPRDEFDAWANAVDDPVWGFDSILESVKKVMVHACQAQGNILFTKLDRKTLDRPTR